MIQCPHCAEAISDHAAVCEFCGRNVHESFWSKPGFSWSKYFFSFQGVTRGGYWLFWAFVVGLSLAAGLLLEGIGTAYGPIADALIVPFMFVFIWTALAVQVKRWHDRNKSANWILINFIPVIGGLGALIELGFLRGTAGDNRLGKDPLAPPESDSLT